MSIEEQLEAISVKQSLAIGLVFAVIYYFAIFNDGSSLENKISAKEAQLVTLNAELVNVENKRKEALRIKAALDQSGLQLKDLVKYLPSSFSSTDFMKLLSDEAQAAGVDILSISDQSLMAEMSVTGEAAGNEYFVKLPVKIQLEGDYTSLLTFLSNLTKIDKIILLSDIEIVRSPGASALIGNQDTPMSLVMSGKVMAFRYNDASQKKKSGQ